MSPINAANLKTVHALIESGAQRQDRPRRLLTTAIAKHLVQPQKPNGLCPSDENPMTKSIATAFDQPRNRSRSLIDAARCTRAIGIPAAVAVVDATGNLRVRAHRRCAAVPYRRCCHRQGLEFRLVWVPDPCLERLCDQRSCVAPLAYRPRMVAAGMVIRFWRMGS